MIEHLNTTYGNIFGTYQTASEWYDVLTAKSAAYARMMGHEAELRSLVNAKHEKEQEKDDLLKKRALIAADQDKHVNDFNPMLGKEHRMEMGFGFRKFRNQLALTDKKIKQFKEELGVIDSEIIAVQKKIDAEEDYLAQGTTAEIEPHPDPKFVAQQKADEERRKKAQEDAARNREKEAANIANYKKSVQDAIKVNKALDDERDKENIVLNARRSGLASLISTYGLENAEVQELIVRYRELRHLKNTREGVLPKSVTALNQPKPIIEKLPKLPEINIEDLTFEDTIMSAEDAVTALNALGSTMSSLKGIVGEGAAGWLEWGANILQAVAQALPALSTLFAANTSVAAAEGAASVASIPYVGPVMAVAAIASIVGAIASLPKFAQGGLVYGPTLGLFGEYAGASSNPEVVAPLDKLRELIAPPSSEFGKVEFVIEGRNLKGVLNRVNRMDSRNNG
jgi:hypothetical protein